MKLNHMLANLCLYAQEHIDCPETWEGVDRGLMLECTSYSVACFLSQNTQDGSCGVEWSVVIDQLVERPAKTFAEWFKIIDDLAEDLGGWVL